MDVPPSCVKSCQKVVSNFSPLGIQFPSLRINPGRIHPNYLKSNKIVRASIWHSLCSEVTRYNLFFRALEMPY
jgi:hypothetical protein